MSHATPTRPDWPSIGSWWKENDPRVNTQKRVVAHRKTEGKVGLQFPGCRLTWAKVERFNGKRGGYTKVRDA